MSNQIKVKIDGKAIPLVLSAEYGLEVQHDNFSKPSDARPRLAMIKIRRESDASTMLGDWASHPTAGHFKSGELTFVDPKDESKILSTVTWKDGFIALYKEEVPDVQTDRNKPMTEYVEISAHELTMNGVALKATWT